jgi:hypothetical protein
MATILQNIGKMSQRHTNERVMRRLAKIGAYPQAKKCQGFPERYQKLGKKHRTDSPLSLQKEV